jgi:hypothetical protein
MMIKPVLLCAALLAAAVAGGPVGADPAKAKETPMDKSANEKMHSMGPMSAMPSMHSAMSMHGSMGMGYADACSALNLVEPAASASPGGSDIKMLLDKAFPNTTVGGVWNPVYYTKKYNGMDPALGGYPTPIDTRYPFEYNAPWLGQPGAGCPHLCRANADPLTPVQSCPKLHLNEDYSWEYGIADHIPPHISLVAVNNAISSGCGILDELFDYAKYECNFNPHTLLALIRRLYPRDPDTGAVSYPPPVTPGTLEYFPLEFPGNAGPHWCSQEVLDAGIWGDYCPYMPEGRYRHPHLALAAVEVYLANLYMPTKCPDTWHATNPWYPPRPGQDTSIAWCAMEDESDLNSQPALPYVWPGPGGTKKKPVPGYYPMGYIVPTPVPSSADPDTGP